MTRRITPEEEKQRLEIGQRLRDLERQLPRGVSKETLIANAGLTTAMVQHWREGVSRPSFDDLTNYAREIVKQRPHLQSAVREVIEFASPDRISDWDDEQPEHKIDSTILPPEIHDTVTPEGGVAPADPRPGILLEDLLGADFYLPDTNYSEEGGRSLILDIAFGHFKPIEIKEFWKYELRLERCSVYVDTTNRSIVSDASRREQKKVKSKKGTAELEVKRNRDHPTFCRNSLESSVSKGYLEEDYQLEVCLVKGDYGRLRARVRAHASELIVMKSTGLSTLDTKAKDKVLDQWVKLTELKFDKDGCLNLCVQEFENKPNL